MLSDDLRARIEARIAELTAERDRLIGQYQAAIGELERLLKDDETPPAAPA